MANSMLASIANDIQKKKNDSVRSDIKKDLEEWFKTRDLLQSIEDRISEKLSVIGDETNVKEILENL